MEPDKAVTRLRWDHPDLARSSDSPWQARYRRLQSWYRETVLKVPPGWDRGKPLGSRLLDDEVKRHPGLNFLNDDITCYAQIRAQEVLKGGGMLDRHRLFHNMLSSMPLCFNLFGELRRRPKVCARALASVLDLDIVQVSDVSVEWAPPDKRRHLNDGTAFDAFVRFATSTGERAFLGIETKYTDPFSPKKYRKPSYAEITRDPASGFRPGAEEVLEAPATNQLWRNALLVHSLRSTTEFDMGYAVVMACRGDRTAALAMRKLSEQHRDPPSLVRSATFEDLVDELEADRSSAAFARSFRRRYLDLTPVAAAQQ